MMTDNLDGYVAADQEIEPIPSPHTKYLMKFLVSSAFHPLEYSKVLMQIGFEPIAPIPGRTLFGQPVMILPNIFKYASYIKRVDGFSGCFVGLGPKLLGNFLSSHYSEKLADKLGLKAYQEEKDEGNDEEVDDTEEEIRRKESNKNDENLWRKFTMDIKRNIVVHSAGIFISQPFHVISIRMMAQFVGKEKIYSGLISSIKEIYHEEGLLGFFTGFIPRLLCDVGCLVIASGATFLVSQHFIKEREGRVYFSTFSQFIVATILYPLQVVSTCMIVSSSRLTAGRPPHMPYYTGSINCLNRLMASGQHKRGNSMFWRYVRKPKFENSSPPLPVVERYE